MSRARMLYEEYQDMTVFQMLQKNAGKFQERTMLSYWRDGQAVSVTHSGFLRDVQRLAAYFDRLGLRGRRIVIDGRNTYEQLAALFAAMSMGAAAVPLCFDLQSDDLRQLFQRLHPSLVLCDEEDSDLLPELPWDGPTLACLGENSVRAILDGDGPLYQDDAGIAPEQAALILATSGSSAQPKLVVLSHLALLPHGHRELKRSIFVFPIYHVALVSLIDDMANGVPNCLSSFRQAFFDIQWYQPHDIFAVPSFVSLLLKRARTGALELSTFHSITSGGAPQDPGMDEYLKERGIFFCSLYGATEISGPVVYSTPEQSRPGSVGRIGPWNEVRFSETGELLVRSKHIMLEYLGDPEATSEALENGWYHTGDVGYLDEDGFLFITGRIKNMIVLSNGENISPEAIESKLAACTEIREAVVSAQGDQLAAAVWCGEALDAETEKTVRAFIAQYNKKVPSYQAVRTIHFREEPFPKTSSGKIKR